MGRQSARLLNNKKDHKDIFFNGNYHKQMWVTDAQANPTLVWEKLRKSDNYFGMIVRDTMVLSDYGIGSFPAGMVLFYADSQNLLKVDWGDGTVEETRGLLRHTYPTTDGTLYEVKIYGDITEFRTWQNYCSAVVEITTPLLRTMYSSYGDYPRFNQMFAYSKTLTKIPDNFLDNFKDYDGDMPIDTIAMFAYSGLDSLPSGLFGGLKISGGNIFESCKSLTNINPTIFSGTDIYSFKAMFMGCDSLQTITSGLFNTNNNVDFSYCFYECTSLSNIPENLFDNCPNISRIDYCFYNDSNITSNVPSLWNREFEKQAFHAKCYYNCINAENYDDIPWLWK